jgi:hypothetical protein
VIGETEQCGPHDEIVRLEARIDELEARIESCRKFILIARMAVGLGGILLAALVLGAIRFDALALTGSIAAVLCGIVLGGSNSSTAKEAAAELAAANTQRAALIGAMPLRVVSDAPRIHH